jgi:hypothetical protein
MHRSPRLRFVIVSTAAAASVAAGYVALARDGARADAAVVEMRLALDTAAATPSGEDAPAQPDAAEPDPRAADTVGDPAAAASGGDVAAPASGAGPAVPEEQATTTTTTAPPAGIVATEPAPVTPTGGDVETAGPASATLEGSASSASRPAASARGAGGDEPTSARTGLVAEASTMFGTPQPVAVVLVDEPAVSADERDAQRVAPHVAGPEQVNPVAVTGRVGLPAPPVRTIWSQLGHAAGAFGPWIALYGIALVVRAVASSAVREQLRASQRAVPARVGTSRVTRG